MDPPALAANFLPHALHCPATGCSVELRQRGRRKEQRWVWHAAEPRGASMQSREPGWPATLMLPRSNGLCGALLIDAATAWSSAAGHTTCRSHATQAADAMQPMCATRRYRLPNHQPAGAHLPSATTPAGSPVAARHASRPLEVVISELLMAARGGNTRESAGGAEEWAARVRRKADVACCMLGQQCV